MIFNVCSIVHSVVCGSSDGSSDFSTLTKSPIKRKFSTMKGGDYMDKQVSLIAFVLGLAVGGFYSVIRWLSLKPRLKA